MAAEKQLPFALRVPNTETRAAMQEARAMTHARFATDRELFADLDQNAGK